jgi:hypothetical protein
MQQDMRRVPILLEKQGRVFTLCGGIYQAGFKESNTPTLEHFHRASQKLFQIYKFCSLSKIDHLQKNVYKTVSQAEKFQTLFKMDISGPAYSFPQI